MFFKTIILYSFFITVLVANEQVVISGQEERTVFSKYQVEALLYDFPNCPTMSKKSYVEIGSKYRTTGNLVKVENEIQKTLIFTGCRDKNNFIKLNLTTIGYEIRE